MKKHLISLLLTLVGITSIAQQTYTISVKIEGLKDSLAFLGTYTGKNLFVYDTAVVKSDGSFMFTNTDMPHGVYSIIPTIKPFSNFDILVNETNIVMNTKIPDLVSNLKIKKSNENKVFYDYIHFLKANTTKKAPILEKRKIAKDSNDMELVTELEKEIIKIDQSVLDYQKKIANDKSDMLVGKLIKMSVQIDMPTIPKSMKDSNTYKMNYYINNYWNNVDLSDDRLGKSALFYNQMDNYFMKVIPQIPDTVIKHIDTFLNKLKPNGFMMKSAIEFLAYSHAKTKLMGMDAIYVHVADKYILNGRSEWIQKDQVAKLKPKVDKLRPTLIGKFAPNLILADSTEKNWIDLNKVKSDFTLLIFWNDDCGHCKKEMPKYKKLYDSIKKHTNIDFEVYAVGTSIENEGWRKFIKEQDLNWINVSDFQAIRENPDKYVRERKTTINSINYRNTYDIFITPIAYLLDKDKKILIKQFDAKQLSQLLPIFVKSNKEKKQ
jgi:thiol-disulfide isomerase/thioredoxin